MTDHPRGLTDQTLKSGATPIYNATDRHPLKPSP